MHGNAGRTLALLLTVLVGCSGKLPKIEPPEIDGEAAGQAAMAQYDKNGDGVVSGKELDGAPSLKAALDRLDANGDGGVSSEEVQKLAEKWSAGSVPAKANVFLDGRKLVGAEVTFDPEPFLGEDVVPQAFGTSDRNGFVIAEVPEEKRLHPNARYPTPGLYLVRISKKVDGKETIPARYNTATELGLEIARRASYMPGNAEFRLRSR